MHIRKARQSHCWLGPGRRGRITAKERIKMVVPKPFKLFGKWCFEEIDFYDLTLRVETLEFSEI